jgi:GTPase SAR1 family protein
MLGESGVGKSSLLLRFTENKFSHDFVTTLGVEYKQKILPIGDKKILV